MLEGGGRGRRGREGKEGGGRGRRGWGEKKEMGGGEREGQQCPNDVNMYSVIPSPTHAVPVY